VMVVITSEGGELNDRADEINQKSRSEGENCRLGG